MRCGIWIGIGSTVAAFVWAFCLASPAFLGAQSDMSRTPHGNVAGPEETTHSRRVAGVSGGPADRASSTSSGRSKRQSKVESEDDAWDDLPSSERLERLQVEFSDVLMEIEAGAAGSGSLSEPKHTWAHREVFRRAG